MNDQLQIVDKYQYLGLIFTKYLSYNDKACDAQSANRALGLEIVKCKAHRGVPFNVFTQLYDALVQSIINYSASVWGNKEFTFISTIQHRASQHYPGLGKYAPNVGVLGEMGWQLPAHGMWSAVTMQLCHLAGMPRTRLNGHVFV